MKTTTEKTGIDKGSKVVINVCDSNGKMTHIVEGNVLRVFPHNIVLDRGAEITPLKGEKNSDGSTDGTTLKSKSYTIPMRWIWSIEEIE